MSDYVVGLTGGIGSGKTTVTNEFTRLGVDVIDADVIAREVVAPGSEALALIAAHFGDAVLQDNGELDRAALRERIFANQDEKAWLNQTLHPRIRQRIESQLQQARSAYCILVAPLLLENDLTYLVDRVLVIDVPVALQKQRTMARDNNSEAQVDAIIAAQMERPQRLRAADDVIDNAQSKQAVYDQVHQLHQQYLHAAQRMPSK